MFCADIESYGQTNFISLTYVLHVLYLSTQNSQSSNDSLKRTVHQHSTIMVALDKNFGDAYISEKHCNFFVNKGNATFEDMNNLINYVTEKVFDKTGIKIEKEIKILK